MPAKPVTHVEYEITEPYVEDVSLDEVQSAIIGLKIGKHWVRIIFQQN